MQSIETFFQNSTMFPTNVDIGILQIGRQSDFIGECAYLQLALEYFKKIDMKYDQQLTEENYTEFSSFINAPFGNKTRHETQKIQINENLEKYAFTDAGDINPVILPMISINRKSIDVNILQELETRTKIHTDPLIKKKIDKFTKMEKEKEKKILTILQKQHGEEGGTEFYNKYFLPDSRYCYMRALALYYFNTITPNENKTDLRLSFNLLSYLNFHYPHGTLINDTNNKLTFTDIQNMVDYMDEDKAKQFLEKMQLDLKTLQLKVKEEQEQQVQSDEVGLLE